MPRRVKSEPRPGCHADALVRDHAQHHGARRQAGAVDDHALARAAQRHQIFEIRSDLASGIRLDAHRPLCSRHHQRRRDGAGQNSNFHAFPSS
jgi:hypothetical protein